VKSRIFAAVALAVLCFVLSSQANELIPFTVTLSRSGTDVTGSGTLMLSNNILRYDIILPAIGPWRTYIIRRSIDPPEPPHPYVFDACPYPDSNSFCRLQADLSLTELEVSELFEGQLTLGAVFLTVNHSLFIVEGHAVLADADSDGVPDYLDECPETPLGSVVNDTGCSIEQLCPCDKPWKNHGEYLKCLHAVTGEFLNDSLITDAERDAILLEAAKSDCGKRRTPGDHQVLK
jgi:hypothetical protein